MLICCFVIVFDIININDHNPNYVTMGYRRSEHQIINIDGHDTDKQFHNSHKRGVMTHGSSQIVVNHTVTHHVTILFSD